MGAPPRSLGLWTSTALVAGNTIGSGVFLLPAALAVYGGISVIGWCFTAAGSLLLALVFMRLGRAFPRVGGPYAYAREAFGDLTGFVVAYGYWISILCGNAAITIAAVGYLSSLFPVLSQADHLDVVAALAALWVLTIVSLLGVRASGRVQLTMTVLKIVPLLVIALLGLTHFEPDHFSPFNRSTSGWLDAVTSSAALTLWAFLGLESATIPAESIADPERTIPRATLIGTSVVALVYILSTVSVMGMVAPGDLARSSAPFADAAATLFGKPAGALIALAGAVSCLGALNGWILLQGQMPLAAARNGLFPSWFGRLSGGGTPALSIVVSSVCVSGLLLLNYTAGLVEKFTFVVMLATLATLVPFLVSAAAEMAFVFRSGKRRRAAWRSVTAVLAFAYSAWAVVGLGASTVAWGAALIGTGLPFYFWMRRG